MAQLFTNNAFATLAAGITASDLALTLATGKGVLFPSPTGGDYFLLTLTQAGASESAWERVKVTARVGDALTIVRAQDGTTAAAWATGDKAELRLGALELNRLAGTQAFENGVLLSEVDAARSAAGTRLFAMRMAGTAADPGLVMPAFRGANDEPSALMCAPLGRAGDYRTWRCVGGADGPTVFGGYYDTLGTSFANALVPGTIVGRQHYTAYQTPASANSSAGVKGYNLAAMRRTAAGKGGFFFHARIIFHSGSGMGGTNARMFVGITDTNNDPIGIDPSGMFPANMAGFYCDAASTNLKFMTGDGTTFSYTDLGGAVPKSTGYMYDLYFYCPPGGAKIYYRVDSTTGNTIVERAVEGSVSSNLPTDDVPLLKIWMRCGTSTTAQVYMGIVQHYLSWVNN